MAEEKKSSNVRGHVKGCMCGACQGGGMMGCDSCWGHGYRPHSGLHMVMRIFLVLFVFWAGVEFGELKEKIRNQEEYMMMGEYGGNWNQQYYDIPRMTSAPTTQADQATTSPKKK